MKSTILIGVAAVALLLGCRGCGNDEPQAGQSCEVIDDCYPEVEPDEIQGSVQCLDRVEGGYCTHLCDTDDDCCAAEGECEDGFPQVCAPFESTGQRMCFLTCEGEPDDYCQENLSEDFGCRSTGGGSANKKVCVPGG